MFQNANAPKTKRVKNKLWHENLNEEGNIKRLSFLTRSVKKIVKKIRWCPTKGR